MKAYVVDTNVAIAANGTGTRTDRECQLKCVSTLLSVVEKEIVAIDKEGRVLDEYRGHLQGSGGPGVGDMFFRYVFDNQYREDKVRLVPISPIEDDQRGFEELPCNSFDPSDRKFLAVAKAGEAVVLNATDSDWAEHTDLMEYLGVEVCQLCPQHSEKRTTPSAG